jgi:hypothetical protein
MGKIMCENELFRFPSQNMFSVDDLGFGKMIIMSLRYIDLNPIRLGGANLYYDDPSGANYDLHI